MSESASIDPLLSPDQLTPYLAQLKSARHCYVAYSGGLDSHVLLHLCLSVLPSEKVTAIHVNHQLSPHANQWAEHCVMVCDDLNVACQVSTVSVESSGRGVEAAAREARYQVFEQQLQSGDLLLQAHHADDQVETVLYRLLRGAGAKGLSGMPAQRSLGQGRLIRPLLAVPRKAIERYGQFHQLQWVTDESNCDEQFDRNYLRHRVVPALRERWPDYHKRIALSASTVARSADLDSLLAAKCFAALEEREERSGWSVSAEAVQALSELESINVIRHWMHSHDIEVPGIKILRLVVDELLCARMDAQPLVSWSSGCIRRYSGRLYLAGGKAHVVDGIDSRLQGSELTLNAGGKTMLSGGAELIATFVSGSGLRYLPDQHYQVKFRRGGERCKPVGRSGSNTLKKLFQEYRLEPWLRDRVPLVYCDDELVAVGDLWVCEGFLAVENEKGLNLQWVFR